jgi:hypothetical protein
VKARFNVAEADTDVWWLTNEGFSLSEERHRRSIVSGGVFCTECPSTKNQCWIELLSCARFDRALSVHVLDVCMINVPCTYGPWAGLFDPSLIPHRWIHSFIAAVLHHQHVAVVCRVPAKDSGRNCIACLLICRHSRKEQGRRDRSIPPPFCCALAQCHCILRNMQIYCLHDVW